MKKKKVKTYKSASQAPRDNGSAAVPVSKTASTVAKVADIAGKVASFIPGPIGMGVKLLSGLFSKNHPSWWPDEEGANRISLNAPLSARVSFDSAATGDAVQCRSARPSRLLIYDGARVNVKLGNETVTKVWVTTFDNDRISRFVLAHVRQVVNAVFLRPTNEYVVAFNTAATLRAYLAYISRLLFEAENPLEFCPDQGILRLLQPDQLQTLRATKSRIEACFVTQIKLPLTLIDYIDWRYAYIHRSNLDDRSALVTYNPGTTYASNTALNNYILEDATGIATKVSGLLADLGLVGQACVDIREAFKDHVQQPTPGTQTLQYTFDSKEFALRANLFSNIEAYGTADRDVPIYLPTPVDKDTTFVASTLSAPDDKELSLSIAIDDPTIMMSSPVIFPTQRVVAYVHTGGDNTANGIIMSAYNRKAAPISSNVLGLAADGVTTVLTSTMLGAAIIAFDLTSLSQYPTTTTGYMASRMFILDLAKNLEYYNGDYLDIDAFQATQIYAYGYLSSSLGVVKGSVLRAVHDHAVKCLTRASRKSHGPEMKEMSKSLSDVVG